MRLSERGRKLLAELEGALPFAYLDPARLATFGVGHLIEPRHVGLTAADRSKWGTPSRPKPTLMWKTLDTDLDGRERQLAKLLRVVTSQSQFDALLILGFNIGMRGLEGSTALHEHNLGHRLKAADAFLLWGNAPGHPGLLLPRRRRERALYLRAEEVKPHPWLRPQEARWCREYDALKRKAHTTLDEQMRIGALRRVMRERRKGIWRVAQSTGWDRYDRRKRYESLLARSR